MNDDTLILDGDEPVEEVALGDDYGDMDMAGDGDDEQELMNEADFPVDNPEDDDFKLDGYDDLGIEEDEDEDDEDDDAKAYDPEYDDAAVGQKRKRVKPTPSFVAHRSDMQSILRQKAGDEDAFILDETLGLKSTMPSRAPGGFGKRGHRKGETLPAYHKRVSHELDSDDELMMEMREKGFSDRQIADKLAKDGRVRYDQKSISTRIMRIRLAQAAHIDFMLKEGYKEWEFDDDCMLMQAYALADIEVNYEVERIRAWRFRKVSEYMRRLNKDGLFSEIACRERYNALTDGTARIPTSLDDDPHARLEELENYRSAREDARNKEKAIKDRKAALERKTKEEAKIKNAQKAEEIAQKREQKESEKAQRAMQRAAAAQVRAQRATENSNARRAHNMKVQKQAKKTTKGAAKGKGKAKVKETVAPKKKAAPKSSELVARINSQITDDTPDPRGFLSLEDMSEICADRGIATAGKGKEQLLSEIRDADDEWSAEDLRAMCRAQRVNVTGNKGTMKYHLARKAAEAYASFRAGVEAAENDEMDEE